MEKIIIEATEDKPAILIDEQNCIVQVVGSSYPENATSVYSLLLDWINNRLPKIKKQVNFEFYFNYINSASRKAVFELFMGLDRYSRKGGKVYVVWKYDNYDEDMLEMGQEFLDMTNIQCELRAENPEL